MGLSPFYLVTRGDDCIVATAIHNGHDTRPEVDELLALNPEERLREEDPFTDSLAQIAKIQLVGLRSRFEVDLNRPREQAVYRLPEDAWGLQTWKQPLDASIVERSLQEYDSFYRKAQGLLRQLLEQHPCVAVLDIHSYNHRRDGTGADPAPQATHPDINVGTGTMDRLFWSPLVDRFIDDLRRFEHCQRRFDVRENVKFQGGEFCRWIHHTFPQRVCALAIEVKKFFMDEWTGQPDVQELDRVFLGLQSTLRGIRDSLQKVR